MNIDLPEDLEMDSTPGTPAEPLHNPSAIEAFRKRFSPHGTPATRSPSSSLINSQVIYAVDPPAVEKEQP